MDGSADDNVCNRFNAAFRGNRPIRVPSNLEEWQRPYHLFGKMPMAVSVVVCALITVFQSASGYVIETADIGHFLTNKMTQEVRPLRLEEDVPNSLLEEAILGTPLLLLLALRGRWLLHCSSVTDQVRTVAFVGPSGYGKSTLGEYLNGYGGWQRVSDDMLPVSNAGGSISAWPHFPQFKLSSAHQPGSSSSSADHAIKYIHYCPAGRINHTN